MHVTHSGNEAGDSKSWMESELFTLTFCPSVERWNTKLWFITGLVEGQISTEEEVTHLAKSWLGLLNKLVPKRQKGA